MLRDTQRLRHGDVIPGERSETRDLLHPPRLSQIPALAARGRDDATGAGIPRHQQHRALRQAGLGRQRRGMKFTCYTVDSQPVEMVPGRPDREWMDAFSERHPYRCLPLVVANTTGWDLLSPVSFTAQWNGGPRKEDIRLDPDGDTTKEQLQRWVASHFSGGVFTFHTGYLFRTEPGWDMWVGGPPNHLKDGVQALCGIVETFWLPFPFTMNWHFTRPGFVSFKKGEPFCFITPIPHSAIDAAEPIVKSINDNPELREQYLAWGQSRTNFLDKLHEQDEATVKSGWQRDYFRGRTPEGAEAPSDHINRRRLKAPRKAEPGE